MGVYHIDGSFLFSGVKLKLMVITSDWIKCEESKLVQRAAPRPSNSCVISQQPNLHHHLYHHNPAVKPTGTDERRTLSVSELECLMTQTVIFQGVSDNFQPVTTTTTAAAAAAAHRGTLRARHRSSCLLHSDGQVKKL